MRLWCLILLDLLVLLLAGCGGTKIAPAPSPTPGPSAGPWASRGWVITGKLSFENPKHGLRLQVPEDWVIEANEEQRPSSYLWAMRKLDNSGGPRLGVFITGTEGQTGVEQFSNNEIATLEKNPLMKVQFSGPAKAPGVYEIQFVDPANGVSGRRIYFVRNGTGYTVAFFWPVDVTPAELAQIDSVRQALDLPEARTAVVPGPSPGPAVPRFGPIAFAYWLSTDLKPIMPSTQFPAGINQVFAVLVVEGVEGFKASDVVVGAWYRGAEKLSGSETKVTVGDRPGPHFWFAYEFSNPRASPGSYRLEVSLNGTVVQTGAFEVLAPSAVQFGPIAFAHGASSDRKLIDPTTQFPAGTTSVFAVFEVTGIEGLKANDVIGTVWYRGAEKLLESKDTASQYGAPVKGPLSGPLTRGLSNSSGMPAGSYRLEVSLNGKVVQTGSFEVLPK